MMSSLSLVTPGAPTAVTAAVNIFRPSGFAARFLNTLVICLWRRFVFSSEAPKILHMYAELHPRTWTSLLVEDGKRPPLLTHELDRRERRIETKISDC